jgi:hypothetical protein
VCFVVRKTTLEQKLTILTLLYLASAKNTDNVHLWLGEQSPESSSLAILHREWTNKVFGKWSSWLLNPLLFVITTRLPLHRSGTEPRHIYRELRLSVCGLQESTAAQEDTYALNSRIMSYLLNMLICVGMISLDNLLQCFLFIDVIDLSSTFNSTVLLICKSLFMFMIYFWIKIKLKMLIFLNTYSIQNVQWFYEWQFDGLGYTTH